MCWLLTGATSAPGCASTTCTNCGIFTTTTGTAPNRVFYIEFRTNYYNQAIPLDYEVALFENHTPPFEFIYNTINPAGSANDSQLVVGVKKDDTTNTQYGCDPTGGQAPASQLRPGSDRLLCRRCNTYTDAHGSAVSIQGADR